MEKKGGKKKQNRQWRTEGSSSAEASGWSHNPNVRDSTLEPGRTRPGDVAPSSGSSDQATASSLRHQGQDFRPLQGRFNQAQGGRGQEHRRDQTYKKSSEFEHGSSQQQKTQYQSDWKQTQGRDKRSENYDTKQRYQSGWRQSQSGRFRNEDRQYQSDQGYSQYRVPRFEGEGKKPLKQRSDQDQGSSGFQRGRQQHTWQEEKHMASDNRDNLEHVQQQWSKSGQPQRQRKNPRPGEIQCQDKQFKAQDDKQLGDKNVERKSENLFRKESSTSATDDKSNMVRAEGAPDKVQSSSPSGAIDHPELPLVLKTPGTLGKTTIPVQSNHFALDLGNLKVAYFYDVTIKECGKDEEVAEKSHNKKGSKKTESSKNRKIKNKVNYRVMRQFLDKHFKDRYPSYDGSKILYASRPLTEDLNQLIVDRNIVALDTFNNEKKFEIEIKFIKTLDLELQKTAPGPNAPAILQKEAIQCIDTVLRNAPTCCFTQIGRSFFRKPNERIINLGGGLEMYYGFYQSVVTGGRPLLNLHLVHKPFPKNIGVLQAFLEVIDSMDRSRNKPEYTYEQLAKLDKGQEKALNTYIKNLKVSYQVPGHSRKTYKVNKLANPPGQEKVPSGSTVLEYFRTQRKYDIKFPKIPLLSVGSERANIKVPAELCVIEKDQSVMASMKDFQTSNMIKVAATDTKTHRNTTMARFKEANYNESPFVKEFGFVVKDKFETMDARVLSPPDLEYLNGSQQSVNKGVWRNKKFYVPKTINKWAIVNLDRYVRTSQIDGLENQLRKAADLCGLTFKEKPNYPQVRYRGRNGLTLTEMEMFFNDQKKDQYDIMFIVLPGGNDCDMVYSIVKSAAEITAGCLTQCIKAKTVEKIDISTAANLLLKINGKLDGINHTFVTKPVVLQDRPFMLLGADVTHPKRLSKEESYSMPSVAAIIASHDPTGFQYNVTLRLQEPTMEYILDLKEVVKNQLLFYYKKNNRTKPEKIIYIRDGVSEGMFSDVLYHELRAIQQACWEVQKDGYNPSITFLVVQKRHHTRLFPLYDRDSEDQDTPRKRGNYNVPAGTCVDTNIVDPTMQNFYLVSHASIKGVSRPTKYCTLYDDLNLSNDEVQELSYYLCHMFARCTRSVSYPAPTYYAHLGALRGKAYIKPAMEEGTFDMNDLPGEMKKIQTQQAILDCNPMFFI